jgi:hypothetical protein
MKLIALIDDSAVIEKILRHLKLWETPHHIHSGTDPPPAAEPFFERWLEDPFPDYDIEPVMAYANDSDFAA